MSNSETGLTVISWLWNGWRPVYNATHVNAWARMLRANLQVPHRAICITDMPHGITECETFPLWPDFENLTSLGRINCFRRLRLFDTGIQQQIGGDYFWSMDLDCVINAPLDQLVEKRAPFRIVQGQAAPYNGSMFLLRAGAMQHVIRDFNPVTSPRQILASRHRGRRLVGSDQAWISLTVGKVPVWNENHGVLAASRHMHLPHSAGRIWFFAGATKPWSKNIAVRAPLLHERYMHYYGRPSSYMVMAHAQRAAKKAAKNARQSLAADTDETA